LEEDADASALLPLSVVDKAFAMARGSQAKPSDPEKELFDRGKEVLGKKAGGLIAQLLKLKGKPELARAAIEQAATKHDPGAYIGAIIRKKAEEQEDDSIWRPVKGGIV
jgi:hypothetical protein